MDDSVYSPWLIELQNQIKFEENSFASTKIRIIFFEYLGLITLIKEYSMNEIFPGTYVPEALSIDHIKCWKTVVVYLPLPSCLPPYLF